MRIKKSNKENLIWKKINSLIRQIIKQAHRIGRLKLLVGISGMAGIFIFGIYLGIIIHKGGVNNFIRESIKSKGAVVLNYFNSLTIFPERIDININFKNFQKLVYKRQEALRQRWLNASSNDWVPANINYRGKTYRIDMRLKGDRPDHWFNEDGWSFKIKLKDDKTLFGMKAFAIQDPRTRGFLREWCLHKLLDYNGLISLRYDFIDVTINGKHQPLYAIEENFDKRLIENNNYREGPIIKFYTIPYWEGEGKNGAWCTWTEKSWLPPVLLGTSVQPYQQKKIATNDTLAKQFDAAKNLLELFRQDRLSTSEVFDIDKLTRLFAILDLTGFHHAVFLDNLKFYYNPITSLIEPIGYDNQDFRPVYDEGLLGSGKIIGKEIAYRAEEGTENCRWLEGVFKDEEFFKKYIQALEEISDKKFLDDFFNKIDREMKVKLRILHKRYPWYNFDKDKEVLYRNQKFIKDFLSFQRRLNVYFNSFSVKRNSLLLEIHNIRHLPVEILNVTCGEAIIFKPLKPTIVQTNFKTDPLRYCLIELQSPNKFSWSDLLLNNLKLNYRILGSDKVFQESIIPWSHLDKDFLVNDFIRQPANADTFSFLTVNNQEKSILFKSGEWTLSRNLIIPKGYTIFAQSPLKLNLSNNAKILSHSPILFRGSEEDHIVISSSDSSGQGVMVMSGSLPSLLEYVDFVNLSNPSQNRWELTGAITFYESPVKISHCCFIKNRSEDALNIIRTSFIIEDSLFSQTFSDAFDADFCKGSIANTSFSGCGNDAIDVSGSIVEVGDTFIDKAGDKGISVGENSKVFVENIRIDNAQFAALASKDMSVLKVNKAIISNSKVGCAVYQKKCEFGPASIEVIELKLRAVDAPYLVQEGSELNIKGKKIKSNQKLVKEILNKYLGI